MRFFWISLISVLLSACAGKGSNVSVPSAKDFKVPDALANQFEVRESTTPPEPAITAPPMPEPKVAGRKESRKGKKEAVKAEKKPEIPAIIPNRWTMPPLFEAGEKTLLDITYFGATAGQLELQVLPNKIVADRLSYHFRAIATSTSVFSLFYRVNDVAESFIDAEGLFSHKYSLKLDESKQQRDVLELYDYRKKKAYYWSKLEHSDKGVSQEQSEIDLVPFTQDGLSAFFFVRTLPLAVGKVFEFPVVNNGKLRTVRVTVLRQERLQTKIGEFPTFVVKPEVVLDGILQSHGDSFMWISDDSQRRILKMDAKIKVGSVIAYLRDHSYGEKPKP